MARMDRHLSVGDRAANICISHKISIKVLLLAFLLFLQFAQSTASPSSSSTVEPVVTFPKVPTMSSKSPSDTDAIRVVFSDVDGTLVHYPETVSTNDNEQQDGNRIIKLPPSATGMQGIISSKTFQTCQEIRSQGVKLVLVSGMRTSTLLKRLPYLPRADAYCSEAGGRIFYPIGSKIPQDLPTYTATPQNYDGAHPKDLEPFTIVEDMEWRQQMQQQKAAGNDGYVGEEINAQGSNQETLIPISERNGKLWEFARQLQDMGYILDTKGYSTCFRVNQKQQTTLSAEDFERLLRGDAIQCPSELSTSTNLGCIDFYPSASGKKNCCQYLASKFCGKTSSNDDDDALSKHAVCACDDDNDLEMALACLHAYIPGVSSKSMADVIRKNPKQFTQTGQTSESDGVEGTAATEKALALILERFKLFGVRTDD